MNNPPAFPLPENAKIDARTYGMTLRDYFAAAAMQALQVGGKSPEDAVAQCSFEFADAMLKTREQ